MKFTMVDPGSGYELHRAGCADLTRTDRKRRVDIVETLDADSVEDALHQYFDAELLDMGWTLNDCRVFPCAKEKR